jgi:hypothetical protein
MISSIGGTKKSTNFFEVQDRGDLLDSPSDNGITCNYSLGDKYKKLRGIIQRVWLVCFGWDEKWNGLVNEVGDLLE